MTGMDAPARYAVTTRSRLKSARLFVPMLNANRRIEKQLRSSPGAVRFASLVAGPTEFWSVSLWRSRDEMLSFMATGAHEEVMWNITRWFDSFWLMRWRPTQDETGAWSGMSLAAAMAPPDDQPASDRVGAAPLRSIPALHETAGPDGAPTFDRAPTVKRARRRVAGASAALIRLRLPTPASARSAWTKMRAAVSDVPSNEVWRSSLGLAGSRELWILAILRRERAWQQLARSDPLQTLIRDHRDGIWMMRWDAESEFGHWDGGRLRHERLLT